MTDKLSVARALLPSFLGEPVKTYVWEQVVHFYFMDSVRISFYFHVNGTLDEIQTVDCDEFEHEKVTHRYRSVK